MSELSVVSISGSKIWIFFHQHIAMLLSWSFIYFFNTPTPLYTQQVSTAFHSVCVTHTLMLCHPSSQKQTNSISFVGASGVSLSNPQCISWPSLGGWSLPGSDQKLCRQEGQWQMGSVPNSVSQPQIIHKTGRKSSKYRLWVSRRRTCTLLWICLMVLCEKKLTNLWCRYEVSTVKVKRRWCWAEKNMPVSFTPWLNSLNFRRRAFQEVFAIAVSYLR